MHLSPYSRTQTLSLILTHSMIASHAHTMSRMCVCSGGVVVVVYIGLHNIFIFSLQLAPCVCYTVRPVQRWLHRIAAPPPSVRPYAAAPKAEQHWQKFLPLPLLLLLCIRMADEHVVPLLSYYSGSSSAILIDDDDGTRISCSSWSPSYPLCSHTQPGVCILLLLLLLYLHNPSTLTHSHANILQFILNRTAPLALLLLPRIWRLPLLLLLPLIPIHTKARDSTNSATTTQTATMQVVGRQSYFSGRDQARKPSKRPSDLGAPAV